MNPDQIRCLVENFHEPVIFSGLVNDWKILNWSLRDWEQKLQDTKLQFRQNYFKKSIVPLWEQNCDSVQITMTDFIEFQSGTSHEKWLYFDYKYMKDWFENHDILTDISWRKFGFPEMSGNDSTIWIGSKGAHTPCHMDTYGCNLIAQIYGRKQWIVFPPEENLRPTRVPYEESSVYSKLNFFCPNPNEFKGLSNARSITLSPGEVLFLPPRWWHYVENIETAISVNVWLPQHDDYKKRVEEAITQLIVAQFTKELTENEQKVILNPNSTEVPETSLSYSIHLLENIIEMYKNKHSKKTKPNESKSTTTTFVNYSKHLEESDNVNIVPKLSDEDFQKLIKDKEARFSNCEQIKTNEPKSNIVMIEKLINSICHPDILSAITDKILKD